jgi:actinin alpha
MQTGKNGLLLWCQKTTAGYANVKVENFHTSWRSGLAFCAIIHYFEPAAIDYQALKPENMLRNNQIGVFHSLLALC